ncbi:UNVERIFIED_CONTAM: hypothetical protein GTU68_029605 [Idotea baltica]|nr:hypothetical protein [Idotea baltica]
MKFTAQQIADILDGELVGNSNEEVSKLSKIEEGEKGSLTFLSNPKYNSYLYSTNASVAIINKNFILEKEISTTLIKVEDAYKAFSKLLEFYNEVKNNKQGREQPHFISDSAKIGENEYIGAFSYIEGTIIQPNVFIGNNVTIGKNCVIHPNVTIYDNSVLGDNVTIHANTVLGADAFYYKKRPEGFDKLISGGRVVIENNVDLGASCTIDKGVTGDTTIKEGTKIDNQVHVGHDTVIGKKCLIASQNRYCRLCNYRR